MRDPRRRRLRRVVAALGTVLLVLAVGQAPAYAAYGTIEGTGSTWSQVIVDQWIADVDANGIKVVYTGGGSSKGRKDFASSTTDFGISEIPYQGTDENGNADNANGRQFAYVPIVAGGTAFTYHLEAGGQLVRDIRLSGETIAKIFTNQIASWADPAIAADNNGRVFPDVPIIPVVRSDGSGTTAQFTTWLDKAHPGIWRPYFGRSGLTSYYPKSDGSKMIGASSSDQVMNSVAAASGNGTIAYVEYSYPINKGFPVVKVLNASGTYVEPTQYAVAVALTRAQINSDPASQNYLTQILDDVYANPDPRAYPLSSYSYMLLPTGANDSRVTTNKRQSLVDFMFYSLCEGQGKAGAYGYSPLPLNLVQAGFEQVAKLGAADPAVDVSNRDVTTCNNPTFVAGDLSRNKLAEDAPVPAECDKQGAGPCLGPGQSMGGSPGGGAVPLVATVPTSPFGSLYLSVSSTPVPLTGTRDVNGDVHALAAMPRVTVRDTRVDERLSGWEVNAQASDFVGSTGTFSARYLGWHPSVPTIVRDDGSTLTVQSGAEVVSQLLEEASPGLARSAQLARSTAHGRGTVSLDADLRLLAPDSVAPGVYAATLTVTLVGG